MVRSGDDRSTGASISGVLLDEGDGVFHGQDLLRRVVGNFAAEFLFERHDQLDRIEAVRAKIVDEAGALGYLRIIDAKMLDDDLFHALGDVTHSSRSPLNCISPAVAAAGDRAVAGMTADRPPARSRKTRSVNMKAAPWPAPPLAPTASYIMAIPPLTCKV